MNARNQKQEDLIRRLEEIRRQRSEIEAKQSQSTAEQPMRRSQQAGTPARQSRNRNRQQPTSSRRNNPSTQTNNQRQKNEQPKPVMMDDPGQYSQETYRIGHHQDDQAEVRRIRQEQLQEKMRMDTIERKKNRNRKNRSNPLIDQLSDPKKLSQAIILNEIISKPVALRK